MTLTCYLDPRLNYSKISNQFFRVDRQFCFQNFLTACIYRNVYFFKQPVAAVQQDQRTMYAKSTTASAVVKLESLEGSVTDVRQDSTISPQPAAHVSCSS